MKKDIWVILGAAALGALPTAVGRLAGPGTAWTAITTPFRLAGKGLRTLALAGWGGNLAAWAVVLLVCALPLGLLAWLRRRGLERAPEDWLLMLVPPELFLLLYYMINPTLLVNSSVQEAAARELMAAFGPIAIGGTVLSTLLAWAALRWLRRLEGAPAQRLAAAFRPLLVVCAALLAFAAVHGRLTELVAQWAGVMAGNDPLTGSARFTMGVLTLLAVMKTIPDLLAACALLRGAELAGTLGRAVFDQEAEELCGRTAAGCAAIARATLVLAVSANLLQLLWIDRLHSSHFSVVFPLFSLMLSAGLFLLCRYLQRGRALQEDSDSII